MAEEEKKLTTLESRDKYKRYNIALNVAKYVLPVVPATIVTGINWNDWFNKAGGGVSLPFGFATLLISVLLSIYLILKKDEEIMKKVSPIVTALVAVTLFGISFMFLASIGDQIGKLLLYTASGLLGALGADEVNVILVEPKLTTYQELVDKYGLDKKSKAKLKREQQAKIDAENQAQEEQKEMQQEEEHDREAY